MFRVRSAAVLGSSNASALSTPELYRTLARAQTGCARGYVFSVVAARAKGARRLRRFRVAQSLDRRGIPRAPGSADREAA
jgi:hypothetical protein